MIDGYGRPGVGAVSARIGRTLAGWGFTPDWITFLGLVLNVPAALLLATGHLVAALILGAVASVMDLFDGAVAKARGGGSRRGAFFDSVCDRVSDALYLGAIAWLLGEQSYRLAVLALACLAGAFLVSYLRSKAAEQGFDAHVGIMERAERLILLGIGVLLQNWWNVLPIVLWIMLVLTIVTIVQRFMVVWRQGATEPPLPVEELRILPEWKEVRTELANREGDEPVTVAVKRVWQVQRAEWTYRRSQAQMRRDAAREERRRITASIVADRRQRERGGVQRQGNRRPKS